MITSIARIAKKAVSLKLAPRRGLRKRLSGQIHAEIAGVHSECHKMKADTESVVTQRRQTASPDWPAPVLCSRLLQITAVKDTPLPWLLETFCVSPAASVYRKK